MLNLSGLLTGKGLSANSTLDTLATYLQLSQSGNDAILKIVLNGSGIFTTPSKTITFTSGWVNGLNDTVLNLIKNKVIWVDSQTSTPLVLDLNGDGVHTVTQSNGVAFDLQGNGQLIKTAWTDGHDGLLALDLNHDGAINSGAELFGDGTLLNTGCTAQNGFEALQQYDLNLDGVIDEQDNVFSDLKVWVDTDGNGESSTLELHSLLELGVQSLDLNAVASITVDNGNVLSWLSSWMSSDGQSHTLADVSFTTQNLSTLENMVLQAATQIDLTQPNLDTYMVNTADVLATSNKALVITGDASDHVSLDAGWHNTGSTATLNGHAYAMWENSSAYVMVDQKIQLHTVL